MAMTEMKKLLVEFYEKMDALEWKWADNDRAPYKYANPERYQSERYDLLREYEQKVLTVANPNDWDILWLPEDADMRPIRIGDDLVHLKDGRKFHVLGVDGCGIFYEAEALRYRYIDSGNLQVIEPKQINFECH